MAAQPNEGSLREVGLFEAKTHLSELVSEVERGASLTITRRGVPVAKLVPVRSTSTQRQEALRHLQAMGRRHVAEHGPVSSADLLQWRDEGRR